jgi:hypothetical protein
MVLIWAVALLCFGLLILASPLYRWPLEASKNVELAVGIVGNLAAAFAGAAAAFALNAKHEAGRKRSSEIETCNQAMLVLIRQFNYLLNYKAKMLDPIRHQPLPQHRLRPQPPVEMERWHVDAEKLAFLLSNPAGAQVPLGFAMQDDRFHLAVMAINLHARFHLDVLQPAIERLYDEAKTDELPVAHSNNSAWVPARTKMTCSLVPLPSSR